ncbi:hypothetical protein FE257_009700 [Aspergillus nanangensis]|uniref:LIM zinc-binding domain-containing protein n=1 Tax=Aspergillus nanangensis TaxID=2582783 RepID=A0AAD4CLG0_ASPNN|nr:hypothetical protein FE257_009700 [Aspergillus nanangensis]
MDLPTIKCSSCGFDVEIMAMGDHICDKLTQASSSSPPAPPPKFAYEIPPRSAARPAPIDLTKANQPFLHAEVDIRDIDALTPSPLSFSTGQRSPLPLPQRSHTTPLPDEAQSPNLTGAFPTFPLPRSMSTRRSPGMAVLNDPTTAPPVPSPPYTNAGAQDINRPPATAPLPLETYDRVPPLPLPKDDMSMPSSVNAHKYGASIDSKSSYRTSLASSRYGDNASKRSTAFSSRRPSFGSASYAYNYLDDAPPIPPSIPHMSAFSDSSVSDIFSRHDGKGDSLNGLDPRNSGEPASHKRENDKPLPSPLRPSSNTNSERLSSSRGSAELFFRSPSQSTHGPPIDFPDPSEIRSHSFSSSNQSYKAFRPSGSDHLHPTDAEQHHDESLGAPRKNSDANSESNLSVSNFARALGLEGAGHAAESSTVSSDSSPSESRSGTSFSSVASEGSSRRKPSDQGRLGPVVEEIKTGTQLPPVLDESLHTESPVDLEPPRIPGDLFSPDSPTDPSINMGGITMASNKDTKDAKEPKEDLVQKPTMIRSATEPVARPPPRPKGKCRGCSEMIMGKSVSSADGRLTGRYHRACFVCYDCRTPFQTADFYVLGDRPFCGQHYHERNGSVCHTCHTGIEGQYLQTMEQNGRGPADAQKFHPECLTCRTCNILLKGEYFEWNGLVYCERDSRRAAASMSPHRFRRPTMTSSPLAHSRGYSRAYPPPPPAGYPGPPGMRPYGPGPGPGPGPNLRPPPGSFDNGPYGPPPPSPGRRFPERRTTRLMMI